MRTRKNALLCAAMAALLLAGAAWPAAASAQAEPPEVTESPLFVAVPAGTDPAAVTPQPAASDGPTADPAAVTESPLFTVSGTDAPAAGTEEPSGTASVLDAMCQPCGVLALADGSLLVTDAYNKVIWQVKDGVSQSYAGAATVEDLYGQPLGGYSDGAREESFFRLPWAIVPFLDGYAVSDPDNNVVRLVREDGVSTINAKTSERLTTTEMGVAFQHPTGLAVDDEGSLYIADTLANAIRKIDKDGNLTTVTTVLTGPMGLCWKDGILYVAETGANRIVRIGGDGRVMVLAGGGQEGMNDGPSALASFSSPQSVAVDDDGTVYVADTDNSAIRRIKNGVVDTLLVRDMGELTADVPVSPAGMMILDGKLYVCDSFARRVFTVDLEQTAAAAAPVVAAAPAASETPSAPPEA